MMKKLLTIAFALMAGFALAADDEKKKRPEGKGGEKGKGKAAFFEKLAGDDGKISAEEWGNSPMAKKAKEAGKGDAIAARFKKMDANGDGSVDKEEFAKVMARGKGKGRPDGKGKPEGGKKPEGAKKPEKKKDA